MIFVVNTKKQPIYFIGFGDFASELLAHWSAFNLAATHTYAGFYDDDPAKASHADYRGKLAAAAAASPETAFLLTFTAVAAKEKWLGMVKSDFYYPNLVHQRSSLGATVQLGKGNIISEGCILTTEIVLGDFNSLNHYVTVGHHTRVGNCNALMTKAHLSGHCRLGDYNLLGVGASILQGKGMGDGNVLGAHACLMHSVGDGGNFIGVPALEYGRK